MFSTVRVPLLQKKLSLSSFTSDRPSVNFLLFFNNYMTPKRLWTIFYCYSFLPIRVLAINISRRPSWHCIVVVKLLLKLVYKNYRFLSLKTADSRLSKVYFHQITCFENTTSQLYLTNSFRLKLFINLRTESTYWRVKN